MKKSFKNYYYGIVLLLFGFLSFFTFISVIPSEKSEVNKEYIKNPPEWSYNANIYEVNLRQFTPGGTIKEFEEQLPRLKEMGIDILWFMPIHPIGEKNRKGTFGSYYSVKDYYEIDPLYGSKEDFRRLVEKIHSNGMYIILDWVANHTAWDNKLIETNPEYYTKDSIGNFIAPVKDWHDVADLNYENPGLRKYMTEAMKYWIKEFNIDGYRCDVAAMVPTPFWDSLRYELDQIKDVFMLAEAWEPELHNKAFDMTYSWEIHHIMNKIAQGEMNANDLFDRIDKERKMYSPNDFRMNFITNHDENSWNGTEFERMGDAVKTFASLSFVLEGMPLIYSGQEIGLDKRLSFFEKDTIQWRKNDFTSFYKNLLELKKSNKALRNGDKGGKIRKISSQVDSSLFAFTRESEDDKILAIFNLDKNNIRANISSGIIAGNYSELFTDEALSIENNLKIDLKAWEFKIYIMKN